MKQAKPRQALVILGLYLVSLLMLVSSALLPTIPVLVFSLTYQPLNVTTTAVVDEEDFLVFSEVNQGITLPNFPQGRYRLEIVTTGGVVAEALADSGLDTFRVVVGEQTMSIEINELIGDYQITWRQPTSSIVTLTMTNFVKINGNLLYGVYIEAIQLYQI